MQEKRTRSAFQKYSFTQTSRPFQKVYYNTHGGEKSGDFTGIWTYTDMHKHCNERRKDAARDTHEKLRTQQISKNGKATFTRSGENTDTARHLIAFVGGAQEGREEGIGEQVTQVRESRCLILTDNLRRIFFGFHEAHSHNTSHGRSLGGTFIMLTYLRLSGELLAGEIHRGRSLMARPVARARGCT